MSYKIALVTYPWKGIISWETSAWTLKTVLEMGKDSRISKVYTGYQEGNCPVGMLRNLSVRNAMVDQCDYILMIDNDMAPDPIVPGLKPFWKTAWEFTMDRRSREEAEELMPATVAAPYFSDADGSFLAYEINPEAEVGKDDLVLVDREDALSRRGMGLVTAAQTGLILYDMRVFHYMPKPWFTYEWKDAEQDRVNLADDFYQTRNLTLAGLPVYIAWDCWSAHLKSKCVARPQRGED